MTSSTVGKDDGALRAHNEKSDVTEGSGTKSGIAKTWEVEVRANGAEILTVGSNFLGGVENIDDYADTVRNCAEHLLAFIGKPASHTWSGWQPIETAPKDGTEILWSFQRGYSVIRWPEYSECFDVGHWMPLPDVRPGDTPSADNVREALRDLVNAVANMKVPQNAAEAALQVMLTIGPALERAKAALSTDPSVAEKCPLSTSSLNTSSLPQITSIDARVKTLERNLVRLLKVIDSGSYRDGTHLSIAAHPAVDDARAALSQGSPEQ